ncbi:MAG: N-formylglutamate deformylase [Rhodospirillales bacterium]|jgi:N-formylglutamate amidohydrolase
MELWRRREARIPLLIDVPHAGTYVPPAIAARLTPEALALPDTDWHVDKLFDFGLEMGAGLLAATHSRYVVDLNRDPSGQALYPGADNTELAPTTNFEREPIYKAGLAPSADETGRRVQDFWKPYHARLQADIDAVVAQFGYCILIDGHSIPRQVPRFFDGNLPDLNLGTDKGKSATPSLIDAAWRVLDGQARFSRVIDGRFTGGYITRHYGQPARRVHALQIEIVQGAYMTETEPLNFQAGQAKAISDILKQMAEALMKVRL